MAGAVEVEGLKELQRAFHALNRDIDKELRAGLRELVQPVRALAAANAVRDIANIGPVWSRMRVGVTSGVVYIAPAARNRGGSRRPNLADRLGPAMQSAVDASEPEIVAGVELIVDRLVERYG